MESGVRPDIRTFELQGKKFTRRTDVTDHGRKDEHPNPHFHEAMEPDSARGEPKPIPWLQGEL